MFFKKINNTFHEFSLWNSSYSLTKVFVTDRFLFPFPPLIFGNIIECAKNFNYCNPYNFIVMDKNRKLKSEVVWIVFFFLNILARSLSRYSFFVKLIFYLSKGAGVKSQNDHYSHAVEVLRLSGNTHKKYLPWLQIVVPC